jgi:hypothetical protein
MMEVKVGLRDHMTAKTRDSFNVHKMLNSAAVARRLHILRLHVTGSERGSQVRWAKMIGTSSPRWNNYEKGEHPLPRDMAIRLVYYVDGLTLDWIFLGREDGLDPELKLALRKLLIMITEPEPALKAHVASASARKTNRRA